MDWGWGCLPTGSVHRSESRQIGKRGSEARYILLMPLRWMGRRGSLLRVLCLLVLLVFLVICGIHIAGVHHDEDPNGLSLVDRLTFLTIAALLLLGGMPRMAGRTCIAFEISRRRTLLSRPSAFHCDDLEMVIPLRC